MSFTPNPVALRVPYAAGQPRRFQFFGVDMPEGVISMDLVDNHIHHTREVWWRVRADSTTHTIELPSEASVEELVQVTYTAIRLTC